MNRLKKVCFQRTFLRKNGVGAQFFFEMCKQLPSGFRVVSFGEDYMTDEFFFLVEHPSFDEVPFGTIIPGLKIDV